MYANGSALDLVAKAIEDLLGSSSFLNATNSGSNRRASCSLSTASSGSTSSHLAGSLRLFLFFLLNAHAWDGSAWLATLSVGSTVVTIATAEAER